jgi:type II secretory pathway pseudopilin PulG
MKKNKLSFTLVELIISISILSLISFFLFFYISSSKLKKSYLKKDADLIKQVLITAKERAILNKENLPWGVYFQNNTATVDSFYIFKSYFFTTETIEKKYDLYNKNEFYIPPPGSSTIIIFSKSKGETATNSLIVIKSDDNQFTATITIDTLGNIDLETN